MEEIQEFIAYAKEMKNQIQESFALSMEFYLAERNPYYIELQKDVEKQAKELGIVSVNERDGELKILLNNKAFQALNLPNVISKERENNGERWIHYSVSNEGMTLTTCKFIEDEEHKKAQAL